MTITEEETSRAVATWNAECRGRTFICTETVGQVSCHEELGTETASTASGSGGSSENATTEKAPEAPRAPAGFALGGSAEELKQVCESAEKQWSSESPQLATCSGAAVDLGFPAQVSIRFRGGKASEVVVIHTPEKAWMDAAGRIRKALTEKYGEAADKQFVVPDGCRSESEFARCLDDGTAKLDYTWHFSSGVRVELTVGKPAEGEGASAIRISYKQRGVAVHSEGL